MVSHHTLIAWTALLTTVMFCARILFIEARGLWFMIVRKDQQTGINAALGFAGVGAGARTSLSAF